MTLHRNARTSRVAGLIARDLVFLPLAVAPAALLAASLALWRPWRRQPAH